MKAKKFGLRSSSFNGEINTVLIKHFPSDKPRKGWTGWKHVVWSITKGKPRLFINGKLAKTNKIMGGDWTVEFYYRVPNTLGKGE